MVAFRLKFVTELVFQNFFHLLILELGFIKFHVWIKLLVVSKKKKKKKKQPAAKKTKTKKKRIYKNTRDLKNG